MRASVLRPVLDAVPLPMIAVDGGARVIVGNSAAAALFGDGLAGRPFVTVLRHPQVNAALESVLDPHRVAPLRDPVLPEPPVGGHVLRALISVRGRELSCRVTVSPMEVPGEGAILAFEDQSATETAEQMRRDFVANVSHELRTPLTALMGFIETLRGPARNDAAARDRFLGIMEREAGRMNRLVGDLLSLSRVEADERRRPAQSIDLTALARAAMATLLPQAQAAGVNLEITAPDEPVLIPGDGDQITQVFQNLIENAVKYGGAGGVVRVQITHIPHEPALRGPAWAVEVSDEGEGIEALHLPRLTERFYRVDAHRSREQGGTGLGLAIVKHIVNRHRGRMRIESKRGKGSRFTIILPDRQSL